MTCGIKKAALAMAALAALCPAARGQGGTLEYAGTAATYERLRFGRGKPYVYEIKARAVLRLDGSGVPESVSYAEETPPLPPQDSAVKLLTQEQGFRQKDFQDRGYLLTASSIRDLRREKDYPFAEPPRSGWVDGALLALGLESGAPQVNPGLSKLRRILLAKDDTGGECPPLPRPPLCVELRGGEPFGISFFMPGAPAGRQWPYFDFAYFKARGLLLERSFARGTDDPRRILVYRAQEHARALRELTGTLVQEEGKLSRQADRVLERLLPGGETGY